jgi:hypothetical protein
MRVLIALAVAGALVVPGTTAEAKPAQPKPDLRTSDVVPSVSGNVVAVYATIKNKGTKKAKANTAAFHLSTDPTLDAGDVLLGTDAVPKPKPKKQVTIYPYLTVPGTVPAGRYYVVVCADSDGKVREKKESNNCATSPGAVTVGSTTPPPPPGTYNVRVAPYFVLVSVNGDTPSGEDRTLNFAMGSQVVLTVIGSTRYPWNGDWQSPEPAMPCDGVVSDAASGYQMTFSSLSHSVHCAPSWG